MAILELIYNSLFSVTSMGSVIARGVLWIVVATVIIISVDNPDPHKSTKDLKANLGFLLLFIILSGGLLYLLFGYAPSA